MLIFEIDKKKMMENGGGSLLSFCRRNGLNHSALYNIMKSKRRRFEDGSKQQAVAEKLISLGVAQWVEVPNEQKQATA